LPIFVGRGAPNKSISYRSILLQHQINAGRMTEPRRSPTNEGVVSAL
jgi:hypothetical protein